MSEYPKSYILLQDIVSRTCRCFNRLGNHTFLADAQIEFDKLLEEGKTMEQALDEMGFFRMCCRNKILEGYHFQLRDAPELYEEFGKKVFAHVEIPQTVPKRILEFPN